MWYKVTRRTGWHRAGFVAMQRVRKLVAETEPDVLKANCAIGFCIASILSVGLAAVLKDWSTWCEPETDVCEETGTCCLGRLRRACR